MKALLLIQLVLLICFFTFPAWPWEKVGHKTIAAIAEKNLSPVTLAKIQPLLGGMSLEEAAVWADEYKQKYRKPAPWHYLDLPVQADVTVAAITRYFA